MEWRDRAKALGQPARQSQAAERHEEEQRRAAISEYERLEAKLSRRVEKVCRVFAQSVGERLVTDNEGYGGDYRWPGKWDNPRPVEFYIGRTTVLIHGVHTRGRWVVKVEIRDYCSIPLAEFTEDKLGEALVRKMEEELKKLEKEIG